MPGKKMDAEMLVFALKELTTIQQTERGEGRAHQITLSAAAKTRSLA